MSLGLPLLFPSLVVLSISFSLTLVADAPPQASVDAIEVAQAIQSIDGGVSLVAGKPTFVRTYVSASIGNDTQVVGELEVKQLSSNQTIRVRSSNVITLSAGRSDSLTERHDEISKSLNFELPAEWTHNGKLSLRLAQVLQEPGGAALMCPSCSTSSFTASFKSAPPLRVRVISFAYNLASGTPLVAPTAADLESIRSWLQRAYPTAEVQISSNIVNAKDNEIQGPFICNDVNAALAAIRNTEVETGTDARTHYYGLISDKYFFMRGCSSGIPETPDPTIVASGPAGDPSHYNDPIFKWDKSTTYAGWYAGHELAHTFGRAHPGKCGETADDSSFPYPGGHLSGTPEKYVGLDVGTPAELSHALVLPGLKWSDVMTYCPYQWISSYTYEAILVRLVEEGQASNSGLAPTVPGQSQAPGSNG